MAKKLNLSPEEMTARWHQSHGPEARAKMRAAALRRRHSPETRAKISASVKRWCEERRGQ